MARAVIPTSVPACAFSPTVLVEESESLSGLMALSIFTVPSPVPSFPAISIAFTLTMVSPFESSETTLSAKVHVPSPLFVAV